ncbi:MAG: glucosaminidase domain-containing protein [Tannerella sp.]|jgi:LysM repeat protein|nr:glucosaminidase domain-containing protein [Tannerella sp.]
MRLNYGYILFFLWLVAFGSLRANVIRKNSAYGKYIDKYRDEAVRQQKKYKIPAGITLAQALLESNAGMSTLAKQSNNHFGIKCHSDWKGGRSYHDDDRKNECFRKYKSVTDSYEDHSRFLTAHSRYARLFNYKITDYKKWAKGLQECGYATDRGYANKLIDIIETYQLYHVGREKREKKKEKESSPPVLLSRDVFKTHGLIYVIADGNDSLEDIADDIGIKAKKLRKYNEMPKDYPLAEGDIVYLQKKKKKADKPYFFHTVRIGESMYSISQRYGIRVGRLYKMNNKKADFVPEEGETLRLR